MVGRVTELECMASQELVLLFDDVIADKISQRKAEVS